jgi:HlyD family secretion protein
MKRALIFLIVIVPLLIVVGAVLWTTGSFSEVPVVDTAELALSSLQRSVNTNGKVEAETVFEIRSPVAGFCRRIQVHEGEVLKKGQAILQIEDPSLPPQLAAAQAELDAARVDLRDIRRGASPEEVSQAEAEVARTGLAEDNARKILQTNEWLLARNAITGYEVEQSRRTLAESEQALTAARQRLKEIRSRYGDLDRSRAQTRVDAAESRLRYLTQVMERLIVRAPENGTLYQLDVKENAYFNPGDMIGLFADLSRLRVRAYVDEPDIGQVAVGERVLIQWDAYPQEMWQGVVKELPAQVVALGTRSVAETLCSIDNPEGTLLPNVNVDVEIQAAKGPEVPSLPRGIVFPEGQREFVWTLVGDRAAKHYVETGRSTSARIEITGGLSPGDTVIDPGDLLLSDGMKVRARGK